MDNIILKIKRRENWFYSFLYNFLKFALKGIRIPVIKPLHLTLYYSRFYVISIFTLMIKVLWWEPLFRARCEYVGKNLNLPNGIPYVSGHLKLYIGDNVTIFRTSLMTSKAFDEPVLKIGNNTTIGYGTTISADKEVIIGDNVMVAPYCYICDSDSHPLNKEKRRDGHQVDKESMKPVKIGNDVWLGIYTVVLKGVNIGDGCVTSAHSLITRDMPEDSLVMGPVARPILRNINSIGTENNEQQ